MVDYLTPEQKAKLGTQGQIQGYEGSGTYEVNFQNLNQPIQKVINIQFGGMSNNLIKEQAEKLRQAQIEAQKAEAERLKAIEEANKAISELTLADPNSKYNIKIGTNTQVGLSAKQAKAQYEKYRQELRDHKTNIQAYKKEIRIQEKQLGNYERQIKEQNLVQAQIRNEPTQELYDLTIGEKTFENVRLSADNKTATLPNGMVLLLDNEEDTSLYSKSGQAVQPLNPNFWFNILGQTIMLPSAILIDAKKKYKGLTKKQRKILNFVSPNTQAIMTALSITPDWAIRGANIGALFSNPTTAKYVGKYFEADIIDTVYDMRYYNPDKKEKERVTKQTKEMLTNPEFYLEMATAGLIGMSPTIIKKWETVKPKLTIKTQTKINNIKKTLKKPKVKNYFEITQKLELKNEGAKLEKLKYEEAKAKEIMLIENPELAKLIHDAKYIPSKNAKKLLQESINREIQADTYKQLRQADRNYLKKIAEQEKRRDKIEAEEFDKGLDEISIEADRQVHLKQRKRKIEREYRKIEEEINIQEELLNKQIENKNKLEEKLSK